MRRSLDGVAVVARRVADAAAAHPLFAAAVAVVGLTFFQILLGGFVAGLDAGLTYNTWPLMDGKFVPDGAYRFLARTV